MIQIEWRYQEIASEIERALHSTLELSRRPSDAAAGSEEEGGAGALTRSVEVEVSRLAFSPSVQLVRCVRKGWSDRVLLAPLAHKFCKLTLQLFARYRYLLHTSYTFLCSWEINWDIFREFIFPTLYTSSKLEILSTLENFQSTVYTRNQQKVCL